MGKRRFPVAVWQYELTQRSMVPFGTISIEFDLTITEE